MENVKQSSKNQELLNAINKKNIKKIKESLKNFDDTKELKKITNNFVKNIKKTKDFDILNILIKKQRELIEKYLQNKISEKVPIILRPCLKEKINLLNIIIKTQDYKLIKKFLLEKYDRNNFDYVCDKSEIKNIKDINIFKLLIKHGILTESDITKQRILFSTSNIKKSNTEKNKKPHKKIENAPTNQI